MAACANGNQAQVSESSSSPAASKLDKVTFGTNWVAKAEHGGLYSISAYPVPCPIS